jgi:tRNA (guanine-N7-)-methyltransferase
MSFGLSHGRDLDDAPGVIGVSSAELPPLPDEIISNPAAGRVDFRTWFTQPARPLEVEIGSGKGTFLVEQAPRSPDTNFLGIEWEGEFYRYAADRLRRRGVTNVRMLRADAVEFLRWRCPDAIVSVIHLYFSDPWPKKKHHKNRVVQHSFLAEAYRVLTPGGELRVVTDHDELWAWDEDHFSRWTQPGASTHVPEWITRGLPDGAAPFAREPFTPPDWVGQGQLIGTNYERKMCVGKPAHACVLRKQGR